MMRALHQLAQILTVRCTIGRQGSSSRTNVKQSPANCTQPFAPGDDPTALSIIHLRACLRRGAGAIAGQLTGLMGNAGADLVQTASQSALGKSSGIPAFVVGATALLITASGVFGEMLSTLNAIWRAQPQGTTVSRLLEACAASIGQVAALGFLLLVSLVKRHLCTGFAAGDHAFGDLAPSGGDAFLARPSIRPSARARRVQRRFAP